MNDKEKKEAYEEVMKDLENDAKQKADQTDKDASDKTEKKCKCEDAGGDEKCGCEGDDTCCCHGECEADDENASDEGDASAEDNAKGEEKDKKSFFSKKEKKDPLKEKLADIQDKYMRQVAEFDNFRKRTEKEKSQMYTAGASSVVEKLLPTIDNFERGLDTVPENEKDGAFADGMQKIYKQLLKQLEELGVSPIEAAGKEFDPSLHNAVMQVDSDDVESGFVVAELQKGYKYHDTVIRHSMVSVAK